MIRDNIKAIGKVSFVLTDEFGDIKFQDTVDNLVVTAGLGLITSRLKDATSAVVSHMALGTSSTAAATTQTALGAEVGRVALTSTTQTTTTVTNDSLTCVATFGAGVAVGAITEAGLLNASSAGTMMCRTVFGVITKGSSDTLTITWKVVFA